MKILKLRFTGQLIELNEFISEVHDFGHEISKLSTNDDLINCDYVLFFNIADFFIWAKKNRNFCNKAVLCINNQVILFKNEETGYELSINDSEETINVDSLLDAIITLSQDDFSSCKKIPLELKSLMAIHDEAVKLSASDYQKIIYDWNRTEKEYQTNKAIHQIFEEQVKKTPERVAIVYENKQITYAELNAKANQLAHYLQSRYDLQGDDLVALCVDRNECMLVAMLGVLKAGAAYVPIDSSYPDERIAYILQDIHTKVLLANKNFHSKLINILKNHRLILELEVIDGDDLQGMLNAYQTSNLTTQIASHNLAYVIYTSGTTGKPKGVMVEHKSIINTIFALKKIYSLSDEHKVSCFTSYVFDVSIIEIFITLVSGAELHLLSEAVKKDINLLSQYLLAHKINVCYLPPILLANLPPIDYPDLTRIIYAGEACDPETGKYWSNRKLLFNYYGPTETAVYALGKQVIDGDVQLIGRPIDNVTAYILDASHNPLPIGEIGELYIGGIGLARGYLNLPDLTIERFINNPFQNEDEKQKVKNSRLYKTGDFARYLPDGNVEYIGRRDFQVKIRGYRIELGEIESKLVTYPKIKQAVALVKEHHLAHDNKYLIGYYVADSQLNEAEILDHLHQQLPEYMIPNLLIWLDKLPLTIAGKLDRAALPDPEFNVQTDFIGPRNDLDEKIRKIYATVLGLRLDKIGISDDFFKLGGNSVASMLAASRISTELADIALEDFYIYRNIESLSDYLSPFIKLDKKRDKKFFYSKIADDLLLNHNKISNIQNAIYVQSQLDSLTTTYTVPVLVKLNNINVDILEKAIKMLFSNNRILRITLIDPLHFMLKALDEIFIKKIYISEFDIGEYIKKSAYYEFNLDEKLLINPEIAIIKNSHHIILNLTHHHILADAISIQLMVNEVLNYYRNIQHQQMKNNYNLNKSDQLDYLDYIPYQYKLLETNQYKEAITQLITKFNVAEPIQLVNANNNNFDNYGEKFSFHISKQKLIELNQLTIDNEVSLYSLLLVSLYHVLHQYNLNNTHSFPIGLTISNRKYDFINAIGPFISTLPLFFDYDENDTLLSNLKKLNAEIIFLNQYGDINLNKIVENSHRTTREIAELMQIAFTLYEPDKNRDSINNHDFELLAIDNDSELFGISITAKEQKNGLVFNISYAKNKYDSKIISYIFNIYQFVLQNLGAANIHDKLNQLQLLTKNDFQQMVYNWNQTDAIYPRDKTIHQWFSEQAERTPEHIALVYEDQQLTYRELNTKANQLAHYLQQRYQLKNDDLVALHIDRSLYIVIGILAVLKSGAAYVPIDPSYPDERIGYILQETTTKVVLANEFYQAKLAAIIHQLSLLTMIETIDSHDLQSKLNAFQDTSPSQHTLSHHLAYVIYTSGTTGRPKGVMIEHRSVSNLITMQVKEFELPTEYKDHQSILNGLCYANYVFDAHVWELFPIISTGNTAHIVAEAVREDTELLSQYMINHSIHITTLPPALLNLDWVPPPSLRTLIVAGEKTREKILEHFKNYSIDVVNAYGPTESTVCSTLHHYCLGDSNTNIGRPIANIKAYILDQYLNPTPLGAVGELYVGGAGVARGYLNLPDVTIERFISNPFQNEQDKQEGKNSRLYKTGDLVRYLPNGDLEYIGRNDFQVKIRGYRIELGEIESKLASYPQIKQVVVVAKEHKDRKNKYLVGYYVAETMLAEDSILNYLHNQLPDYMVPNNLMHLNKLPLTINNKIDLKALPEPELSAISNYVAPHNELEYKLCELYADVLGISSKQMGIRDDFFKLGGDSIVCIQLVSRLRQNLKLTVSVKDIFANRTIEQLYNKVLAGQLLLADDTTAAMITESGILSGELGLLPIQSWFFNQVKEGFYQQPGHWNQAFLIKTGILNPMLLKHSLIKLIDYHDAFRLNFRLTDAGDYQQYYSSAVRYEELNINYLDVSQLANNDDYEKILTSWQSNFRLLNHSPLYQIGYLEGYEKSSSRIFFSLHHLLVDSVSWRIIAYDLYKIYNKLLQAHQNNCLQDVLQQSAEEWLGKKGTSYRQWVKQVKAYAKINIAERDYWQKLTSTLALTESHLVKLIAHEKNHQSIEFNLDKKQTHQLLTESNHAYHTEINDLLLTGFGKALMELTNQQTIYITLEGHGREEIAPLIDITHTVGWFTTMYPVKLEITSNSFAKSIIATKENIRKIPNKGIGYGALFGYSNLALPRISFNYLGQFDQRTETSDFAITDESCGVTMSLKNLDDNIINVTGAVNNGELRFLIASKMSPNNLNQFAKNFKQQLLSIIDHTVNLSRSYLTANDINDVISQDYLDKIQDQQTVSHVFLANSLQQGFIYHALNQGEKDSAYHVQLLFDYHNSLEPELLKMAWIAALNKYPSLRLRFAWDDALVQIIDEYQKINWQYIDATDNESTKQEQLLQKLIAEDRQHHFQLDQGRLLRVFLIKREESKYTCIISTHHAISDGWSYPILLNFIHKVYSELQRQRTNHRAWAEILEKIQPEQAYVLSQAYLQEQHLSSEDYWRNELASIIDYPDLSGLLRQNKRDIRLSEYRFIMEKAENNILISGTLYQRIKAFSYDHGVTINALLQYGWHHLLSVYGNAETTIVGTVVSGRNLPIDDIENSVGLYINTLPLIMKFSSKDNILTQLETLQHKINEINSHSDINLAKLQPAGRRLFDSLFVFENYPTPQEKTDSGIKLSKVEVIEEFDYPLIVFAYEQHEAIHLSIKYAGELFTLQTIQALLTGLTSLISEIVMENTLYQKELKHLSAFNYQKIIHEWNKTDKDYHLTHQTISQLFVEQVQRTPERIALIYEDKQFTYHQLNAKANQLAHYLQQRYQLNSDDLVALCVDRNEHMLIAVLAILKAGAAYVPIDPNNPDERISYILQDTSTHVVLANETYHTKLAMIINQSQLMTSLEVIDSSSLQNKLNAYQETNPESQATNHSLAYVIYTSGTTGLPKGVMIEHEGIINRIQWMNDQYPLKDQDRILQKTPYVFDVSVWELFWANWFGATVVLAKPEGHKDTRYLINLVEKQKISILHFVPSMLEIFNQELSSSPELINNLSSLHTIFCSGEALHLNQVRQTLTLLPNVALNNLYGPTEASIDVLFFNCRNKDLSQVYIGKPITNTKVYVLSSDLNPLPIGAIGELYIGGVGLARGYLNLPDLTAQRFVDNPFASKHEKQLNKNLRLYKTGDLVRYLPDGNIEYLGRNDFQVKINGFRIELGEIEAKLANYPQVKQAVVLAKERLENKSQYLVGYYVADTPLVDSSILNYLHQHLPDYMVPSILIYLDKLPLTVNGKLDRQALPDPEFSYAESYVAPRNDVERKICQLYAEVLNLPKTHIGLKDDFFRLGGNSILAIKLVSKLNNEIFTHSKINLASIFKYRVIADLIDASSKKNGPTVYEEGEI